MSDMRLNVTLDETDQKNLIKLMSVMPGTDEQGKPRTITMPEVLREALRRAARGLR